MSKNKKLRKRFTAFVNQLTPDRVREQLFLAYLQMEKCQQVLRGADVEPVTMMDNGASSDLELFYRCKKVAEELVYLNKMVHDGKKFGAIKSKVGVDTRELENELDKLRVREYLEPKHFDSDAFLRFMAELSKISKSLRQPKYRSGQEVWYMFGDRVQHSMIVGVVREVDGVIIYKTKLGHETAECETFGSLEELLENLKNRVNE